MFSEDSHYLDDWKNLFAIWNVENIKTWFTCHYSLQTSHSLVYRQTVITYTDSMLKQSGSEVAAQYPVTQLEDGITQCTSWTYLLNFWMCASHHCQLHQKQRWKMTKTNKRPVGLYSPASHSNYTVLQQMHVEGECWTKQNNNTKKTGNQMYTFNAVCPTHIHTVLSKKSFLTDTRGPTA